MTIYDFLETLCYTELMEFSIFDCNTDKVTNMEYEELRWSDYADYEIGGLDVWFDQKKQCIHFEFNIDVDEEE